MMRTSERGIEFIAAFEGFRGQLYEDAAGHCTIGYGHLVHRGRCDGSEPEHFRRGLSRQEALALLRQDIARFEAAVNRLITVPLNQHQFDALVSFTFNLGAMALEKSDLRARLNGGDYASAPEELARWNKAGNQVLPGLVRRRRMEGQLFVAGIYGEGEGAMEPQIKMAFQSQQGAGFDNDCFAACLAMVLSQQGQGATVEGVIDHLGLPRDRTGYGILEALRPTDRVRARWGVQLVHEANISPARLREIIEAGSPVIALINHEALPRRWQHRQPGDFSHFVVVNGIRDGYIFFLDPGWRSEGAGRAWMPEAEFFRAWSATGRFRVPRQGLRVANVTREEPEPIQPAGYLVGVGVLAQMAAQGDEPISDELYGYPHGSTTFGEKAVYLWLAESHQIVVIERA